jgi:hypothetical protein
VNYEWLRIRIERAYAYLYICDLVLGLVRVREMKGIETNFVSSFGMLAIAAIAGTFSTAVSTASVSAEPIQTETKISQVRQMLSGDATAQNVTSVSQLSDVQPTDWAFTALQSLVERYGCIAGYPDRTYRGNRALSRYEFAAGLNACLDKINELLSSGLADKVSKEDLAALQRLQEEFAVELATLKGRVDALETKTATLEAQQFSTTTKLSGQAIVALTGGFSNNGTFFGSNTDGSGNGRTAGSIDSGSFNTTVNARVRLDFNTSFTGNDLLITRLEAGNGGGTAGNLLGAAPLGDTGNVGFDTFALDYGGVGTTFTLAKLRYDFNLSPDIRGSLGPVMHVYDHVDVNSYANNEAVDFTNSFFLNNPLTVLINPQTGGAGAFLEWNPGKGPFSARALYIAANGSDAQRGTNKSGSDIVSNRGLTGDPYQGTFEVEYAPKSGDAKGPFAIRLQYTQGSISNVDVKSGGVNLEWAFTKGIALFGRYGFGTIDCRGFALNSNGCPAYRNFVNTNVTASNLNPQTFMVGLAFPDLLRPGSLAGIAVGQPFIESKVGNSTQTNVEAFFNFPISSNISITPDIQFIFNPNNNSANGTITVGTIRTVFSF